MVRMDSHVQVIWTRRTEPFVMWLMQPLVPHGMMFPPMDPVDAVVRERQEAEKMSSTYSIQMGGDKRTYKNMEKKR